MGVVIRQGLKSTAVQYAGVAVGAVAMFLLYPLVDAEYGLVQVLISSANLLAPFAMLGSYGLAVRYFPRFTNPDAGRQGFLTLLLLLCLVGSGLLLLVWPWLDALVERHLFKDADRAYASYLSYVPWLVVTFALLKVLIQYTSNFRRIVVPTLLEQFLFKLTLPALLLLFYLGYLQIGGVVWGTIGNYVLALVGMVIYLATLGQLKLPSISPAVWAERKDMSVFAGYGVAGMLGTMLAFRIDTLMVAGYLDFAAAGQYSIALFMSEVIAKPYTNLKAVVGPQVSEAWANDDRPTLQKLYRQSSDNLLLGCGYLFAGILVCYPALVQLSTKSEVIAGAFLAFVFLGLSRLVDASTSVNEHLITYSSRYRFNMIAVGVLAVGNVLLNIAFVPRYGVAGAGLATLLSLTAYNGVKVAFAGKVFALWPFGKTTAVIAGGLLVCTGLVYLVPLTNTWWLDIPVRGGLLTVLMGAFAWYVAPSPEVKGLMRGVLSK